VANLRRNGWPIWFGIRRWCGLRPIHVVIADNAQEKENIVVTVYEPDRDEWEPDLKRRKDS
jgi:hypothetical protein